MSETAIHRFRRANRPMNPSPLRATASDHNRSRRQPIVSRGRVRLPPNPGILSKMGSAEASPSNFRGPLSGDSTSRLSRLRSIRAFTFLELLVVLAILSLLVAIHWPALGNNTRSQSQTPVCLNNHYQLIQAWLMNASDNRDRLPGNLDGGDARRASNTNRSWCVGWLDFSGSSQNTNVALLLNGQLGRYTRSAKVYKCPADTSLSRGTTGLPRVRSVAMNSYIGERTGPFSPGYRQFRKLSEIVDPAPAKAFVFIDEREDSINDPWFPVEMDSFDPSRPAAYRIVDYPADWHNRGANLSFADGHVETWCWKDQRTMPLHRAGTLLALHISSVNNPDVARVQAASSRKIR